MEYSDDNNTEHFDDEAYKLPTIIRCDKSNKRSNYDPIIISETESHKKRLSFVPMIVPDGDRGKLRGHIIYEPIKKGNDGRYHTLDDVVKISKKDVTLTTKQKIDLELRSREIEKLRCILNSLEGVAEKPYETISYLQIDQFFTLSDLHKLLANNWKMKQQKPELYRLLLSLTDEDSQKTELADVIIDLVDQLEGNSVFSDSSVLSKIISILVEVISDSPPEYVDTLISLISDDKKELLKQHLRVEELKQFVSKMKDDMTLDKKEDYWQELFKNNSWILSQIFPYPFILSKAKAYVGGKNLDDGGGFCDYLIKNNLTSNVSLVEIKKNSDQLVKSKPYRDGLNTYAMTDDLIGGVVQLLDYKNTLIEDSARVLSREQLYSFNPQCVLIIGTMKDLNQDQKRSFELYRSDLKDVVVITYDELINRIELILNYLEKSDQ